jgi:hypothetical protein
VVNARGSVKIRQLTHAKTRFCFVAGVIIETEQLLVAADPVNVEYSPLSIRTLKNMALEINGIGLRCPHTKSSSVPKGSAILNTSLERMIHIPWRLC